MDTDGGMVELLYYDGTLIIDGKTYVVNDYEEEGLETAPDSGYYIQTCNDNGNHVIGLTLVSN